MTTERVNFDTVDGAIHLRELSRQNHDCYCEHLFTPAEQSRHACRAEWVDRAKRHGRPAAIRGMAKRSPHHGAKRSTNREAGNTAQQFSPVTQGVPLKYACPSTIIIPYHAILDASKILSADEAG